MSRRRLTFRERLTGRPFARQHLQTGRVVVDTGEEPETDDKVKKSPGLQQWQELTLTYADKVPIVSAGARYYEDSTKRVRFYLQDADTEEAIEGTNSADAVVDILNNEVEEIARAVGLRYLIGESRHTFDRNKMRFDTRGAGELYLRGTEYKLRTRDGKETKLGEEYDVWRSYDPDRKWSDLATSSHKALIDVMEAFVIAYAEERAISIRLALNTGVVGISEEVFAVGGDEDVTNSEGSGPGAALEARFAQMLEMTIRNPRDSASFVPPVLVTPAGLKVSDAIQHVSIAQDRDKRKIAERIDMLKEEYAVGTDLPADIAKGFMADLNHWNAWSVDEAAWKNYLAPKIQSVVQDAFIEIGAALNIDTTGLAIGLDNTQLLSPKDMGEAAGAAYDRGVISDVAYRKYAGFTDDDAPDTGDENATTEEDQADGEVTPEEDAGDGVVAAAATDGKPNIDKLNRELSKARYGFEQELRLIVEEIASELAPDAVIAAAADPDAPDPLERAAARISAVVRRGQDAVSHAAARGLATRRAQEWAARHEARLALQADRAGRAGAQLVQGWLTRRGATSIPGRDAYGIARSIESEAAGGAPSMHATGTPTQARPKTILEEPEFLRLIEDEGSARPVYEWEHGSPPQPFAPHAELEGTTWTADEEREVLDNPDEFPPSAIYHPGDHDGCTCRYDIEFEEI